MSVLAAASTQFGNNVLAGAPRSNDGGNHANDRHYHTLREDASQAHAKHAHFASEASKAYKRGDKAEASALSQKAKKFEAEANRLNEEAATWVFRANNTDSAADEIDLHGLFVKEALIALDARIQVCRQHNQPVLKAIVGKGLHSETHISKLRPAVMDHCRQQNIPCEVDRHNPGVVILALSEAGPGPQQGPSQQGYAQYSQGGYGGPAPGYNQQQPGQQQFGGGSILRIIFSLIRQCLN